MHFPSMKIAGAVVRPPLRSIISSRSRRFPVTLISRQATPLPSSRALAQSQYGHADFVYMMTSAITHSCQDPSRARLIAPHPGRDSGIS